MQKQLFLVTTGALIFNIIFWQEKVAVNAVLFDMFIIGALFHLYPASRNKTISRWLLLAHLVCLAMIIVHNTLLSKIGFSATLVLFVSFAEYVHRSPWYAGGSFLLNFSLVPASFTELISSVKFRNPSGKAFSKVLRFAALPIVLLTIFFLIYSFSNSIFSKYTNDFLQFLTRYFLQAFSWFSFPRLLFFLLGVYLVSALILKSRTNYFAAKEKACTDDLSRTRISSVQQKLSVMYTFLVGVMGRFANGVMALKNANTVGVLSLLLLNLLLLIVNVIDIHFIWINFEFSRDTNIYKMVHEGTELLIVSIILAMMLLIFIFKGNLNFYRNNRWLKIGAYLWIFQNIILVISVLLRDYYYIVFFGLAYKRIGVLFFLLAVLTGLATVFIKIYYKKSNYFLFRVNAWAAIVMLVASTMVNWDHMIAQYNFRHNDKVPVDLVFIFKLSDKALPVIDKHKSIISGRQKALQPVLDRDGNCTNCYLEILEERKNEFLKKQDGYSWLSWNYNDAMLKKFYRFSQHDVVSKKQNN